MSIARGKPLNNTTIRTMRGTFDYANPKAADVNLVDILDALSRENRYANHVPRNYSVAEHSLLALEVAQVLFPDLPRDAQRAVLVHDFAEGYTGDVSSPLKHAIGPVWYELERKIEDAVFEAIGVDVRVYAEIVKAADNVAYLLERRFLFDWRDIEFPDAITDHLSAVGIFGAFHGHLPVASVGYSATEMRHALEHTIEDYEIIVP